MLICELLFTFGAPDFVQELVFIAIFIGHFFSLRTISQAKIDTIAHINIITLYHTSWKYAHDVWLHTPAYIIHMYVKCKRKKICWKWWRHIPHMYIQYIDIHMRYIPIYMYKNKKKLHISEDELFNKIENTITLC